VLFGLGCCFLVHIYNDESEFKMLILKSGKDRNPALHILSLEKVLWLKADFLIHQIVGAACIKAAVTVGGNVPLTFGKENSITNLLGMLEVQKE
jgi:hypothetical protein